MAGPLRPRPRDGRGDVRCDGDTDARVQASDLPHRFYYGAHIAHRRSSITTKSWSECREVVEAGAPRAARPDGRFGPRSTSPRPRRRCARGPGSLVVVSSGTSKAVGPRERKRGDGERAGAVEAYFARSASLVAEGAVATSRYDISNVHDVRVCAPKHAPRDPCNALQASSPLVKIVECGAILKL